MPTLTTSVQHIFESPSYISQRWKINKGIQIRKEVKLSLLADDMILYIVNPKDTTEKLLEVINEFSKLAGWKVNIQKFVALFHINTNNELSEREIKRAISFTTTSNRIKYLGINLIKELKTPVLR